jgi:adenosylcobinamide-GDP ribazoletransferase
MGIWIRDMLRGLVTAFRTLTIIPIPGRDASKLSDSLPFFPVVGFALGALLWLVSLIDRFISDSGWPMGIAVLMLLANIISTRALHLDGLADFADALGGGWDKRKRLEIMKDSSLGVFGGVAVIVALLCKWLAFSRLVSAGSTLWVILIFIIARTMQVHLAVRLDYARVEGGTASSFVQGASTYHCISAYVITTIAALVFGPLGLGALAVAAIITWMYEVWCRQKIGGITGDLLGAGNEIVEVTLLLVAAMLGKPLMVYIGWNWVFS